MVRRARSSAPPGRGRRLCCRRRRCAIWRNAGSRRWRHWSTMRRSPRAWSRAEIERLEQRYPRIDDILPLSPLQEGLLFHALYDAQAPDVYTVQLELGLEGALDSAALEASLEALLGRHG